MQGFEMELCRCCRFPLCHAASAQVLRVPHTATQPQWNEVKWNYGWSFGCVWDGCLSLCGPAVNWPLAQDVTLRYSAVQNQAVTAVKIIYNLRVHMYLTFSIKYMSYFAKGMWCLWGNNMVIKSLNFTACFCNYVLKNDYPLWNNKCNDIFLI